MPVHLQSALDHGWSFVRFEDLKTKPLETLAAAAEDLGIEASAEGIKAAVGAYDFKRQRAESKAKWFLAESAVASWVGLMTPSSLDYLESAVGEQARAFGYDLSVRQG